MEYLTLQQYEEFATKLILMQLGNRYLTDENIGIIINFLASADKNYNPEKNTTRSTWRMTYGLNGTKSLAQKQKKMLSLNLKLQRGELSDTIEDKNEGYQDKPDYKGILLDVMDSVKLSKRERQYINMYLDNKKFTEIARECGVAKQAVAKAVANAIRKMRTAYAA